FLPPSPRRSASSPSSPTSKTATAEAVAVFVTANLLPEIHLRRNLIRHITGVILIPIMEPGHICPDAVGELPHIHVVAFERLVIPLPSHLDPVLRPGQFVR